ncbi:DUF305 domain-containing protein [Kitasatospora sp. NPDC059327]|uniref:DUF305 domain-containing protein n=1 Tax=Kitasatospora sp. NPDC059327 TaxID=3346803 RepID=UPI0036B0EDB3
MKPLSRTVGLSLATLAAAAVLTACGGGGHDMSSMGASGAAASGSARASGSSGPGAAANGADVMFAQMMIPHHRQAVEMAQLAPTRAADPRVRELATKIAATQDPEITTMTKWLTDRSKPTAAAMDHGGTSGMTTTAAVDKLKAASGAEFDKLFLTLMIEHHNGAVQMAADEAAKGGDAELRRLAETIRQEQTAEIATLQKLLTG